MTGAFHPLEYTPEEQAEICFVVEKMDENLKINEVPFPLAVPAVLILCANYCSACFNTDDEIVEEFRKTLADVQKRKKESSQ